MSAALDLPLTVVLAVCWVAAPTVYLAWIVWCLMEATVSRQASSRPGQGCALQNIAWGIPTPPAEPKPFEVKP